MATTTISGGVGSKAATSSASIQLVAGTYTVTMTGSGLKSKTFSITITQAQIASGTPLVLDIPEVEFGSHTINLTLSSKAPVAVTASPVPPSGAGNWVSNSGYLYPQAPEVIAAGSQTASFKVSFDDFMKSTDGKTVTEATAYDGIVSSLTTVKHAFVLSAANYASVTTGDAVVTAAELAACGSETLSATFTGTAGVSVSFRRATSTTRPGWVPLINLSTS